MRASVAAMQNTTARIFKDKSLIGVESEVIKSNTIGIPLTFWPTFE